MSDNNDNVAWRSDDAEVEMTDSERVLAAEIAEDQRAVAPWMDVDSARVAAAVARVRQRVVVDVTSQSQFVPRRHMASSGRRVIRIGTWAAALATAAAVLLVVALWSPTNSSITPPDGNGPVAALPTPPQSPELDDSILADLLIAPLPGEVDSDALEWLTLLAGTQDPDTQFLAMLLES